MEKIGLLGGTFDPPHIGHVIVADEVKYVLDLDEIWFIPTNVPPHKREAVTSNIHRRNMVQLAIEQTDYFKLNTIEFAREGKSYTIDTIRLLKQSYPDVEFYFIIGADMVEYLPNWKAIDELIHEVQFVGVNRTGYKVQSEYPIIEVDVPFVDISSTELKQRILEKKPFTYFLPESVANYIKEHQLYGYRKRTSSRTT